MTVAAIFFNEKGDIGLREYFCFHGYIFAFKNVAMFLCFFAAIQCIFYQYDNENF